MTIFFSEQTVENTYTSIKIEQRHTCKTADDLAELFDSFKNFDCEFIDEILQSHGNNLNLAFETLLNLSCDN